MRFVIPVRLPDLWSRTLISGALTETLNYLSDDTFHFEFVEATQPLSQGEGYFPQFSDAADDADEIALFSGGLELFSGAVETIVDQRKRMILVGHHSSTKVFAIQKELARQIGGGGRSFYVPVNVTNANVVATETTQRTRSFLFASLAFVIARMFNKDSFTFFENGVVSFNLPIARDVLGARATRTTHPTVIRGFQAIFSALAQQQIDIRTPYLWNTKKEIVEKILQGGFGHLLATTASCAHPHLWSHEMRHCGVCSQCLDRRFAVLAAGAERYERAESYGTDLLTGARGCDEDVRMAVAYLKYCRRSRMATDTILSSTSLKWFRPCPISQACRRKRRWENLRFHQRSLGSGAGGRRRRRNSISADLDAQPPTDHLFPFAERQPSSDRARARSGL